MAFYSVRLDEEGKEIERSRRNFRKVCLDTQRNIGNTTPSNDAVEQLFNNANNTASNYKTVRCVNSATFIEKDLDISSKLPTEKYEYQNDTDSDSNSPRSNCNSDEAADQWYQAHISPDVVPLLDLNSNESFPSIDTISYSYRKLCEVTKMIQKPEAYKEWLDAKRTAKYYEAKRKQEKEREAQKKSQQRRALAQQKYKEWVTRKNKQLKHEKQSKETKTNNDPKQFGAEPNNNEYEQLAKQRKFQAWLKKKLKQEKEFKEKINEELKLEMRLEQIRRQKAEEIYKDWVQTAIYKPKPVPLNRGLFTLKGSISTLYINPVSWVFVGTTESSGNI